MGRGGDKERESGRTKERKAVVDLVKTHVSVDEWATFVLVLESALAGEF